MDFLSKTERTKIAEKLNNDEVLVNAIKKVLLAVVYTNGTLKKDVSPDPSRNGALSLAFLALSGRGVVTNADLGEDLRGLAQGVSLVENGFKKLSEIKAEAPEEKPEGNPAV